MISSDKQDMFSKAPTESLKNRIYRFFGVLFLFTSFCLTSYSLFPQNVDTLPHYIISLIFSLIGFNVLLFISSSKIGFYIIICFMSIFLIPSFLRFIGGQFIDFDFAYFILMIITLTIHFIYRK